MSVAGTRSLKGLIRAYESLRYRKQFATLRSLGTATQGKRNWLVPFSTSQGATPRWGKVDEGTTVTDHEEDSIARKITLNLGLAHASTAKPKSILSTRPDYAAFVSHARPAVRVSRLRGGRRGRDQGVEVQTEKVLGLCERVSFCPASWWLQTG